ncbi:hypothetical protein BDW74DRAFT_43749 [Aspergillus multicolor]|uniref:uncharacterized protein n=1 Tax=Aspergillus multicolor TaxID=41759 RepID=UPI003CCDC95F
MGQRHNRRRTRPRSRKSSVNTAPHPAAISSPADLSCAQSPDAANMETEQYRLFGGEPGDDVGLCYRMLEYFGGLDYIDPPQELNPLPG